MLHRQPLAAGAQSHRVSLHQHFWHERSSLCKRRERKGERKSSPSKQAMSGHGLKRPRTSLPAQSSSLPQDSPVEYLSKCNPHPRDSRIQFDEASHTYFADGKPCVASVSALWQRHFPEFDGRSVIDRCFDGWRANPSSRYGALIHEMEKQDPDASAETLKQGIEKAWKREAEKGTRMHARIEHLLNAMAANEPVDTEEQDEGEMHAFNRWRAKAAASMQAYRTEWRIFDDRTRVAGTIDSIWTTSSGDFIMVDWKRCKPSFRGGGMSADDKAYDGRTGSGPCSALPDTKFYHYAVQQNLYKCILNRCYGIRVRRMYLAQFHPELPTYHFVQVPELADVANALLES